MSQRNQSMAAARAFAGGLVVILTLVLAASGCDRGPTWGYGEDDGPERWAELDSAWVMCSEGQEQSPVYLGMGRLEDRPDFALDYGPSSLNMTHTGSKVDLLNTGRTIVVRYDSGSVLNIGAQQYQLVQFHFHTPGEHRGPRHIFGMEIHLVHVGPEGELAVVAVVVNAGEHHPAFEELWAHLPERPGAEVSVDDVTIDVRDFVPRTEIAYRYRGSLTTPPCQEGVEWLIMGGPIQLSSDQIEWMSSIIGNNSRPVQPFNGRMLVVDTILDSGRKPDVPIAEGQ